MLMMCFQKYSIVNWLGDVVARYVDKGALKWCPLRMG